jgi:hypothetical protein
MPAVQTEVNRVIDNLEHASTRQREVLSVLQTDTVDEIGQLREDVTALQTRVALVSIYRYLLTMVVSV